MLLIFVRDKTIKRLIKMTKGKTTNYLTEIHSRHRTPLTAVNYKLESDLLNEAAVVLIFLYVQYCVSIFIVYLKQLQIAINIDAPQICETVEDNIKSLIKSIDTKKLNKLKEKAVVGAQKIVDKIKNYTCSYERITAVAKNFKVAESITDLDETLTKS
nr:unnamed protein product [Callosobruchus analis]